MKLTVLFTNEKKSGLATIAHSLSSQSSIFECLRKVLLIRVITMLTAGAIQGSGAEFVRINREKEGLVANQVHSGLYVLRGDIHLLYRSREHLGSAHPYGHRI